ncbi:MAG: type II toxin-antitoxin system VapC family toxin [Gammaproteobacteria bacterium]
MSYLLDTNACSVVLRDRGSKIATRLVLESVENIVVCSVVKAELYYGARRSDRAEQILEKLNQFLAVFRSLPFDDAAAETYGRIRADLAAKGTPIGPNDLMIAAIAVTHGAILVTHNTREFERVDGLQWEDWET